MAERHKKILELLKTKKSVRVNELSREFSVTEETIRRDLEKLEAENKLSRSHGGAVLLSSSEESSEIPYFEREIEQVKEKKEIAYEAVKLVKSGDRIVLDASSTAWYMAKLLPDKPLTVLTNSIKVALELSTKPNVTVISTGGVLTSGSLSYVGPLTESSLNNYHVNKAFISCKGLHPEKGLSESNEQQAQVKRKMMSIADAIYIMIDHSKIGIQDFTRLSDWTMVSQIITDRDVSEGMLDELRESGLPIVQDVND